MAGRTYKQQQEIIDITTKKNINKSKSVCSFDGNLNNSKTYNKKNYQRLNHEEKMEILHKINHKKNKNQNSQSGSEKNSENANLNNNNNNNELFQKNANNNDTNFDIGSKKSPSRSIYNQEYYDINSETDKNNLNNINIVLNKFNKAGNNTNIQNFPFYADGTNQTYTDLRSNQRNENNEEYSKNKINQIKNDLLNFKNQIKKELKDEVREEIRNEFSKQMITVNKINNPEIIQLDGDYNFNSNSRKISNYYDDREKRKAYDGKNEAYKKKNYNKTHKGFLCINISFDRVIKRKECKEYDTNFNYNIVSFYGKGKEIKCIKKIIHPIYGECLLTSGNDENIDLWINNNGF
jgi:hypothetical protein